MSIQNISLPMRLSAQDFQLEKSQERESIDNFLRLIIDTPKGSYICDSEFGNSFSTFRFEIFNEMDGVVNFSQKSAYESSERAEEYQKKISGSSKNSNTFAYDLKCAIELYELRLTGVEVDIAYDRLKRVINIFITAKIASSDEPYSFSTVLNIWNKK